MNAAGSKFGEIKRASHKLQRDSKNLIGSRKFSPKKISKLFHGTNKLNTADTLLQGSIHRHYTVALSHSLFQESSYAGKPATKAIRSKMQAPVVVMSESQ